MWTWLVEFFRDGGPVMVPLAVASVAAVAIILERYFSLRRSKIISPRLADAIERLHYGEPTDTLEAISRDDRTPLGAIVRVALNHLDWPKNENTEAVQTRARAEVMKMELGLVWLEIIVGISPLMGLLGTIGGMKYLFKDMTQIATGETTAGLGIGISHALNTTFFGLLIAIVALIGWSYFNRKVERLLVEMESMISDLLAKLYRDTGETRRRTRPVPPTVTV